MSTTVLLTEHEPATRGLLERQLRDDGFELALPGSAPDLVLAGNDAELERWCGQAPVIVLGPAEAEADERVRAFRRGCDDYLARPFHYDELVERMRAVLRRVGVTPTIRIVAGPLTIDRRARLVTLRGARVELAQKEYELLVHLATEPERVFTAREASVVGDRVPMEQPIASRGRRVTARPPQIVVHQGSADGGQINAGTFERSKFTVARVPP